VKNQNSAFVGTGLEDRLKSDGIDSLVVVGLTTEHCVSTSVRMGANLGFEIILITDATAAFAKKFRDVHFDARTVHQVALANLESEFAKLLTAEGYLKEMEGA
jgi:nicotinamidase-related amidase